MAWTRQLHKGGCKGKADGCTGCGLWASTVRFGKGPNDRITRTHRLKTVIEKWAAKLAAERDAGEFVDPRRAEITVGEWRERCKDGVRREKASIKRDESHWRCHVAPRW